MNKFRSVDKEGVSMLSNLKMWKRNNFVFVLTYQKLIPKLRLDVRVIDARSLSGEL